jgi:hypothetical protein
MHKENQEAEARVKVKEIQSKSNEQGQVSLPAVPVGLY